MLMERLLIDFCDNCGKFTDVRRKSGNFVCFKCLEVPVNKIVEKPKEVPHKNTPPKNKPPKENPPKNKTFGRVSKEISIKNKPPKNKPIADRKTKKHLNQTYPFLPFLKDNPNSIFTTRELWERGLNGDTTNYRSFANALKCCRDRGLIFSRDIYIRGRKSSAIHSVSEEKVENYISEETVQRILWIVSEGFINTKDLCGKLELSHRNIPKLIKCRLLDKISIWRFKNIFYYVERDNEKQRKKMEKQYPGIKEVY